MESLDRELARKNQAELNRQRFESPTIRTSSDIKRVLAQLEPSSRLNAKLDDVTLAINMPGTDTDSKNKMFHVSAKTKTNSARDILIEGLNLVKQREETAIKIADTKASVVVNGKEMKSPPVISDNSFLSIDPVIGRTLGGYRSGHFIQWDLIDGFTYRYDIFVHRLTRFKTEAKT
jgi:hypothetical protein